MHLDRVTCVASLYRLDATGEVQVMCAGSGAAARGRVLPRTPRGVRGLPTHAFARLSYLLIPIVSPVIR